MSYEMLQPTDIAYLAKKKKRYMQYHKASNVPRSENIHLNILPYVFKFWEINYVVLRVLCGYSAV